MEIYQTIIIIWIITGLIRVIYDFIHSIIGSDSTYVSNPKKRHLALLTIIVWLLIAVLSMMRLIARGQYDRMLNRYILFIINGSLIFIRILKIGKLSEYCYGQSLFGRCAK